MSFRRSLASLWVCCLSFVLVPVLWAQKAPFNGVALSLDDLTVSEQPWSNSQFVEMMRGSVSYLAVLLPPGQGASVSRVPAGLVQPGLGTVIQSDAKTFAKRFSRWMQKHMKTQFRYRPYVAGIMALPPGVTMEPSPQTPANVALQRYMQELGYMGTLLLESSGFEAGGGLKPGHYMVFDAKGLLRYYGPEESKAEQVMRTALRELELDKRKSKP